jgi:hypothetical protein
VRHRSNSFASFLSHYNADFIITYKRVRAVFSPHTHLSLSL